MKIKIKGLLIFGLMVACQSTLQAQELPYKNKNLPVEKRVEDLLGRMTLEEKVGQLSKVLGWEMYDKNAGKIGVSQKFKETVKNQKIGLLWATLRADPWTQKTLITGLTPEEAAKATNALQKFMVDSTRLGIPLLLSEETPHGHMAIGATTFPTAIGQASTWNPFLIEKMAGVIAAEASAVGAHNGYGPVLDLAREPRWSRTEESYGEDPFLVGRMGEAMVRGMQGEKLGQAGKVFSTLKHFVAYGVPEGGHNGGSVSVGERDLRMNYLFPFEKAVRQGAWSVMTAYNSIDGIPCSSNSWLLNEVLRKEWGFKGFVVSDLLSIQGLSGGHNTAANPAEGASQALNAGLDVDLSGSGYGKNLLLAIKEGLVSEDELNQAVGRVLTTKFRLGLFENPFVSEKEAKKKVASPENIEVARQVARESIILLKNDGDLLPLKKDLKRIAVIGPNADNVYNQLGDYTAPQADGKVKTVLAGIKEKLGARTEVEYVKGAAIRDMGQTDIPAAVAAAKRSDVVVLVVGGSSARDFKTSYQATGAAEVESSKKGISDMESGEGFDRASLDMMGDQLELMQAIQATGKPVVLVVIKGRPLNLNWADEHIPAILDAWYPGQEGGTAIADVLFGDYNPAGRLPISVPRSIGQLPVYYNHQKPKHHPYIDEESTPLYSFGYGLSYTDFEYKNLEMGILEGDEDVVVEVSFDLVNTGNFDGEEVPQLYLNDEVSSAVSAVKQLRGFDRVPLLKGETRKVSFTLDQNDLKLWTASKDWQVEKGKFKVLIGPSSDNIKLNGEFEVMDSKKLK